MTDMELHAQQFLARALALPQQHVPSLYRHRLLHSGNDFAQRWRCAAQLRDIAAGALGGGRSLQQQVQLSVQEFVAACAGEMVEIAVRGVLDTPHSHEDDELVAVAKGSILQEGWFLCRAHAFSLQLPLPLPCPCPPLYAPPALVPRLLQPSIILPSRSCVSASCATRNRTACALTSWLAAALMRGRNITVAGCGAQAAALAAKVVMHRNRRLCGHIVRAAVTCPVVIDCSSLLMRAGFAADAAPCVVFTPAVCRWTGGSFYPGMGWRADWCGSDALSKAATNAACWKLSLPIVHGLVANWDDMERLWQHTFGQLNVQPEHHPVLLTEAVMNPKAHREQMVQIMFETFTVPALYVCSRPALCLLASRRSTGVVVQCSDGAEGCILPIIDGHVLPHAMSRARFHSGDDMTSHMITLLQLRGRALPALESCSSPSAAFAARSFVRDLRQALCYVALDYELEVQAVAEATFEPPAQPGLAPAEAVCIGSERLACPEIMFRPLQPGVVGLHTATDAAIKACDASMQQRMYGNIVLAGSSLAVPGMAQRMAKEMRAAAAGVQVSVTAATRHSAWSGGAIMAASPAFDDMCMLRYVYEEHGPTAVHAKCPAALPV